MCVVLKDLLFFVTMSVNIQFNQRIHHINSDRHRRQMPDVGDRMSHCTQTYMHSFLYGDFCTQNA